MAGEAGLDLARADAVAAAGDQVVVPSDEAEVSGFVAQAEVAADQPVAAELGARSALVAPVLEEHHRVGSLVRDAPQLARGQLATLLVDDRHGVPWNGGAGPTGPYRWKLGAVSHHEVAFGLSVEFVDGQTQRAASPLDQLLAEALAARGEAPEANAGLAGAGGAQQLQRRRRHEDVADLVTRHQPHGFAGFELARQVSDGGDPVMPGAHHE